MGNKAGKPSIAPVVTKINLYEKKNDADYWSAQPPVTRIAALEEIRREYHGWKEDAERRLQRVYKIVKRP